MSILQLNHVSLKYPGQTKLALDDINYTVNAGDFVVLVGSNGSGKSSLLKLLHRDYVADTGEIYFEDHLISHYSTKVFSRKVAVLTQNCADSQFNSLTVYENYCLVKRSYGLTMQSTLIEQQSFSTYLQEYNPNLADKLNTPITELSGGERQALALAFCLLQPPSLLLLDEHTSALDPKTSAQIMQLTDKMIKAHHITCVLTTHDLDFALQYGNRMLMLQEGVVHKLFDGDDKRVLNKHELVGHYF